jgi:16S rRNA (guanine966-N2)-methyltransferase
MRVIAGEAKGTRLGPVPPGVRPLSDRAREGLFASLAGRVVGSRCLDLFAGTGAVGIEALSRGATSCVFVEQDRGAAATVSANLAKTRLGDRAEVRTQAVSRYLHHGVEADDPFDLVFLDPPYALGSPPIEALLGRLTVPNALSAGWTVVLTRGHKSPLPAVPLDWAVARQLRYGDSLLTLYREVGWS